MSIQKVLLEIDDYIVHLYYDEDDPKNEQINESRDRGTPLGGQYSGQLHKAHTDANQDHLHIYQRNKRLFALNIDGTAHDKSHGYRIPNKVAKGIQKHFPDFQLPPNNLIESYDVLPIAVKILLKISSMEKDDLILLTEG